MRLIQSQFSLFDNIILLNILLKKQNCILTFEFIIIRIDNLQIFLGYTSCTLILIQSKNTFQKFHHFFLIFMPHRRTSIYSSYVIAAFYSWWRCGCAIRLLIYSLIISISLFFLYLRQILINENNFYTFLSYLNTRIIKK